MNTQIADIKELLNTRLDILSHIVDIGQAHFNENDTDLIHAKLAPDMRNFGDQIAMTCDQARGFSQWCAGEPIQNWPRDFTTTDQLRQMIVETQAKVNDIAVDDSYLDQDKRIGMGPTRSATVPAPIYVRDYIVPNLYFHLTAAYMILRHHGATIGKQDFLRFLAPYIVLENQ